MSLTIERVRELLRYDLHTGLFTRAITVSSRAIAGQVVGSPDANGYLRVMLDRRFYLLHRLAVFYVTGAWPQGEVDHRDGRKSNNAWANLRDVPRAINGQNQRQAHRDSLTGLLGVTTTKKGFSARICVNRKTHRLGNFKTADEAHAAYVAAKRDLHIGGTL